jgi:hypothetical protein
VETEVKLTPVETRIAIVAGSILALLLTAAICGTGLVGIVAIGAVGYGCGLLAHKLWV